MIHAVACGEGFLLTGPTLGRWDKISLIKEAHHLHGRKHMMLGTLICTGFLDSGIFELVQKIPVSAPPDHNLASRGNFAVAGCSLFSSISDDLKYHVPFPCRKSTERTSGTVKGEASTQIGRPIWLQASVNFDCDCSWTMSAVTLRWVENSFLLFFSFFFRYLPLSA